MGHRFINDHGRDATLIHLPEIGIYGNTHFPIFLVEHLFADIFVRDILSRQNRKLVTISILSAMTGTKPQLKGHLGIAMRMGYNEAQLKDFIAVLNG